MKADKQKTLRKIYTIALSVLSVIAGLLLIIQSQRIYHRDISANQQIYTAEIVKEYLTQILPVLILWVLAVIAGYIIWQVFPPESKKLQGTFSQRKRLNRLKARIPEDKISDKIIKAERVNVIIWSICIVYGIIALVFVCLCFFNKDNYVLKGDAVLSGQSYNPTRDMLNMLPKFLPWLVTFFLLTACSSVYLEHLAKKETKEVMRLIALCTKDNTLIKQPQYNRIFKPLQYIKDKLSFLQNEKVKKGILLGFRIALPVLGVTLFVIGIFNGGLDELLKKAIVICTECIGLG